MHRPVVVAIVLALAACSPAATKKEAAPTPAASPVNPYNVLDLKPDTELTPELVKGLLDKHGATAVVRGLADYPMGNTDLGYWAKLEAKMSEGADAWLALAPALQPGVDGATGEGLTLALQAALAKNAAGVLRLPDPPFAIATVCTVGLIEPPPQQVKDAKAAAIAAVQGVTDPALATAKTACLAELAKVRTP